MLKGNWTIFTHHSLFKSFGKYHYENEKDFYGSCVKSEKFPQLMSLKAAEGAEDYKSQTFKKGEEVWR